MMLQDDRTKPAGGGLPVFPSNRRLGFFLVVVVPVRFRRWEQDMWLKLGRLDGILQDELSPAEPLLCLLYEDEADRLQMLSRIENAGLGELPRVMISVEAHPAQPVPTLTGARARQPAKVA